MIYLIDPADVRNRPSGECKGVVYPLYGVFCGIEVWPW